jgi:FkbM family methyltransferase
MLSNNRMKVVLIIIIIAFIFFGVAQHYRILPFVFDSSKPSVKVNVTAAINATEQWNDPIALARERDRQYCAASYPNLEPALEPQTVGVVFMQKSFRMTLFRSADIVCSSIIHSGSWESDYTTRAMSILLELRKRDRANGGVATVSGDGGLGGGEFIFVDVGANVGWFTLVAASHGIPVIAIEAMEANSMLIRHNLCQNNFNNLVTLIQTGIGDKEELCRLISDKNNRGDGIVECGKSYDAPVVPGYALRQHIQMVRLDTLFGQTTIPMTTNGSDGKTGEIKSVSGMRPLKIGVMKIDIEGSEPKLFQGGQAFFARYKPLFVITEVLFLSSRESREAFNMQVTALNYTIYDRLCMGKLSHDNFVDVGGRKVNDICLVHDTAPTIT